MAKDWKGFERGVAKALGGWWGCVFRRTPSSGAWGKQGQSRFNKHQADAAGDFHGDIVAPPEANFPFSVECKCYKEVELYKALYGKSNVYDWWSQCVRDTPDGMFPMLVMKENMKKPLLVINFAMFKLLQRTIKAKSLPYLVLKWNGRSIFIFDMSVFIGHISANRVRRALYEQR